MNIKAARCTLLLIGCASLAPADPPTVSFHVSVPASRWTPAVTVPGNTAVVMRSAIPNAGADPAPGVYAAQPFSAIVVVPVPMDTKSVVRPNENLTMAQIVQPPPVTLVPLHR